MPPPSLRLRQTLPPALHDTVLPSTSLSWPIQPRLPGDRPRRLGAQKPTLPTDSPIGASPSSSSNKGHHLAFIADNWKTRSTRARDITWDRIDALIQIWKDEEERAAKRAARPAGKKRARNQGGDDNEPAAAAAPDPLDEDEPDDEDEPMARARSVLTPQVSSPLHPDTTQCL